MGKLKKSSLRRTLTATGGWARHGLPLKMGSSTSSADWTDYVQFSDNVIGWKDKIKKGSNVSTTMAGVRGFVRGTGAGLFRQTTNPSEGNYRTEASGDLMNQLLQSPLILPNVPNLLLETARSQAEIQFSKRFSRHTTQFQTGVFAAELYQTVKMLASPARKLRESVKTLHKDMTTLYRNVRRNEFRNGRTKTLKALRDGTSGVWLEWKFGVEPFIQDADDAARAFRALASGRTFDMVRFTGEGKAESATSYQTTFSPLTPGFLSHSDYKSESILHHTASVQIKGAWKSNTTNAEMPLPLIFGVGLKDVVPTAWEALPWSWFADYFSNMGDVLGAWSMRGVSFGWINEIVRLHTMLAHLPPPAYWVWPNGFVNEAALDGSMQIHRYIIDRHPYSERWAPSVLIEIPGIGGHDQTKWLNIAAVLAMRLPP